MMHVVISYVIVLTAQRTKKYKSYFLKMNCKSPKCTGCWTHNLKQMLIENGWTTAAHLRTNKTTYGRGKEWG